MNSVPQLIKIRELPGGVHPPENKIQSMQLPLGQVPVPPRLVISLTQHIGSPAKPVVRLGDKVLGGQLIAVADGVFSANVHASSSGVVSAIGPHVLPHASGIAGECITITTDGKHTFVAMEACEDFSTCDHRLLLEKIKAAGITGLGGAGFPTAVKLNVKSTQLIDTLIINGAECEPYITADDMLMQMQADDVIAGSLLLSHILQHPKRIVIAVEDNKPKAIATLRQALMQYAGPAQHYTQHVEIISVPTKYPSGGAKQLTQIITGREIPHGHHSADVGASCINVATAAAAWRAVRFGEPLVSRITTVVGEALNTQRNIQVLLGTPIDYVLQLHGFDPTRASRVVMGGSMMGFTLEDLQAPVIKTTNCIWAPTKTEASLPPPAQACIRCGMCAEACPASLLPQQLFWYAQAKDTERLQAHHLFDCIECGACSYVCPSHIPLVHYYRAAKNDIRQHVADKEKADRARQRFEFRQKRIEKEEAEKEARRIARKKAADDAKQILATQKAITANSIATPVDTDVSHAIATASVEQLTFSDQKSRLERILGAAQNSLASAREPLVPRNPAKPITQDQLIKQQARIKQAELKLAEAEKKLADFVKINQRENSNAAAIAVARAHQKIHQTPEEKLRANVAALRITLEKAREKVEQARNQRSDNVDVLELAVDKLNGKLLSLQAELDELSAATSTPKPLDLAEQQSTHNALGKARSRMALLASMDEDDKQLSQIRLITERLSKTRDRLAKAEAENDTSVNVLRLAVENLETKLKELNKS